MDTPKKDYKNDDMDLPIRLRREEISNDQIKANWDAIYMAITELEEKKSGSN